MTSRRLLLGTCAVALLAIAAGRGTGAAFSAVTSNGANEFSAAGSFGGCASGAAPTTEWIGGFEMGRIFGGHASSLSMGNNTANVTLSTTTVRSGAYAMRVNATGVLTYAQRLFGTLTPVTVQRFAVLLPSLPAGDVELAKVGAPASTPALHFRYHASTQRFALQFTGGAAAESTTTVTAGQWYVIDMRLDQTAATWTGDWRVNAVAQSQRTVAGTAGSTIYAVWYGTTLMSNTYTAYYDDISVTRAAADYPLGNGKVLVLRPAAMGTNSGATNFRHEDGSAISASTYLRLDDVPMSNSTDWVNQVTVSSTSYLELEFQQTAETCIRMVQGVLMNNMGSTNQSNVGKTSVFNGSTERVVYSGSMSAPASDAEYVRVAQVQPSGAQWTTTELNGLVMRFGYSTDVAPLPRWDAMLIEYEVGL